MPPIRTDASEQQQESAPTDALLNPLVENVPFAIAGRQEGSGGNSIARERAAFQGPMAQQPMMWRRHLCNVTAMIVVKGERVGGVTHRIDTAKAPSVTARAS
jgi:hypothetical protein